MDARKKNSEDEAIVPESADANAEEAPSLLVLNYARECTAEAPANLQNFVTSSEDCLEKIRSSDMINRKTATFLTVGPSGSGKSTIIKGLLQQEGLIDVSVKNLCQKYNIAEGEIRMQALVWCHLHRAVCDVVKNRDIPMEKWRPLPSTKKAHWRSALQSVSYCERAVIYEALATNGTSLNPESSRFFTLLILRHSDNDVTHFFFDFPGYESLLQTKSCPSGISARKLKNVIDIKKSSQFITKSLLAIVQALISEFDITALNFIAILKIALESSRGGCMINCLGRDISKFTPNMSDLSTKLIQKFKIKKNMRAAVAIIKSPPTTITGPSPSCELTTPSRSNLNEALIADKLICSTPKGARQPDTSLEDFSPIKMTGHGRRMLDISSEIDRELSGKSSTNTVGLTISSSARNPIGNGSSSSSQGTSLKLPELSGGSSTDSVNLNTHSSARHHSGKESSASLQGIPVGGESGYSSSVNGKSLNTPQTHYEMELSSGLKILSPTLFKEIKRGEHYKSLNKQESEYTYVCSMKKADGSPCLRRSRSQSATTMAYHVLTHENSKFKCFYCTENPSEFATPRHYATHCAKHHPEILQEEKASTNTVGLTIPSSASNPIGNQPSSSSQGTSVERESGYTGSVNGESLSTPQTHYEKDVCSGLKIWVPNFYKEIAAGKHYGQCCADATEFNYICYMKKADGSRCNKGFRSTSTSSVKHHILTHDNLKFKCFYCTEEPYLLTAPTNYVVHCAREHPETLQRKKDTKK